MGITESNWASRWSARRAARREFRADLSKWKSWDKVGEDEDKVLAGWTQGEIDAHRARSPEDRLERVTNELNRKKGVTREVVVKGMLGAGFLAALAIKGYVDIDQRTRTQQTRRERERGEDRPTHLEVLDECKDWFPPRNGAPLPDESFLTFGGLGCVNSWPHALPMYKNGLDVPKEIPTPMSFLVSSLEGKKIPEVADIIRVAARESGSLSFYGQSNGSVVVLEALHYLKEKKGIVIPVNRFVLNCSPFDFGDAKVNYIEEWLSKFLVGTSYEPGTISQFLYLLRENWSIERERIFDSFLESVQKSWDRAQGGEPPGPWIADLRILVGSRLDRYDFTGIITPETEMLFLKSQNDDVVYNDPAHEKYRRLAQRYRAKFTLETMDRGIRHGDSEAGSRRAESWFRQTGRITN